MSNPRHYCPICRVWCQGDKESIRRHEMGMGHKSKAEARLKAKRSTPNAEDPEVHAELARIEARAAAKTAATMRTGNFAGTVDSSYVQSGSFDVQGPGRRLLNRDGQGRYQGDATADWYDTFNARSFEKNVKEEEKKDEEDDGGEYEIRGVKYFQGKTHSAKFVTNAPCDVWDPALEEWRSGVIVRVKRWSTAEEELRGYDIRLDDDVRAVPNTESSSRIDRHFANVLHREGRVLKDVNAKDLRVRAGTDGKWAPPSLSLKPEQPEWLQQVSLDDIARKQQPPISSSDDRQDQPQEERDVDENTGIGGWETVAVREIDEVKEEEDRRAAEERRLERKEEASSSLSKEDQAAADRAKELCDLEEARDARNTHLGVHESTTVYKGVPLAANDDIKPPLPVSSEASTTSFKKRRTQHTSFRHKQRKV